MKFAASFLIALLLAVASWTFGGNVRPSYAQSSVGVIGPVTPNDCTVFFSQTQLADSGASCNGGAGGFVRGPATSIVGDVPIWNNLTGTLLADPGVIYVSSSTFVGIGTTTPQAKLHINKNLNGAVPPYDGEDLQITGNDGGDVTLQMDVFQNGSPSVPQPSILGRVANGTGFAPSATPNNSILLQAAAFGYGTSQWGAFADVYMDFNSCQSFTNTAHCSNITFGTTPANTVTLGEVMRLGQGLAVGTTTDPGAGIVNVATGYRIGNAAVSGNVLRGNGSNFVSATLAAADLSNGVTGSGSVVLSASPTLSGGVSIASTGIALTVGTGAVGSGAFVEINGGASGTGAGGALEIAANGTAQSFVGTHSAITSGAFNANLLLMSKANAVEIGANNAVAVTVNTSGGVSIGTTNDEGAGTVNANAGYYANSTAGVSKGPCTTVTAITVVGGIVTSLSGAGC